MYIVKIEDGVWLAPWDGDPGRTLVRNSAKHFKTEDVAKKALGKAKSIPYRSGFPHAQIEEIKVHLKCKGSVCDVPSEEFDMSCGYESALDCGECMYGAGRKNPEAKCNQL